MEIFLLAIELLPQIKELDEDFEQPISDNPSRVVNATTTKITASTRPMIKLPDGTEYPTPRTEDEMKKFGEVVTQAAVNQREKINKVHKPQVQKNTIKDINLSQNKTYLVTDNARDNDEKFFQSSFRSKPTLEFNKFDGALTKSNGQNSIGIMERPVTADKIFPNCDPANLKPGTTRSGICEAWDEHLAYLEGRLAKECVAAGENIYTTVKNVDGIFVNSPLKDPDNPKLRFKSSVLHEYSSRSEYRFISPSTFRLYRQFEYYDIRKKSYITKKITNIDEGKRKYTAKIDITKSESKEPQSRFEVTYKNLTAAEDHGQGFYGDLTWIIDRTNNEILAERKSYFFMVKNGTYMADGTRLHIPGGRKSSNIRSFYACKDYAPRATRVAKLYLAKASYPKSAYEFVSRVLIPTPFSQDENNILYDLSIDKNKIKDKRSCVGKQTVGPHINPDNLQVTRNEWALKLSVRGDEGSLTCPHFFIGAPLSFEVAFSDGLIWNKSQMLEHGNIILDKE